MKFILLGTLVASAFSAAMFKPPLDDSATKNPSTLKSVITRLQDVVKDIEEIDAKNADKGKLSQEAKSPIDPKFDFKAYEDCLYSKGGCYRKDGLAGNYFCIIAYADGGKVCKSSDECLGDCIVRNRNETQGKCQENNSRFGCWMTIEEQKKGGFILCRD